MHYKEEAKSRLETLRSPSRKSELWTYFPTRKIPEKETLISFFENAPTGVMLDETLPLGISTEEDFSALLPLASTPHCKIIEENANEMAMIKCQDDLGHTIFKIKKNAKLSLEILDNKVDHLINAERFDFFLDENAHLEIFFANPTNENQLRFRHFKIHQSANSKVFFTPIERGSQISRTSLDVFLQGEKAHFELRTLNALKDSSEAHYRLNIYHQAPETTSVQFVRNLLEDASYVSYDGSVIVEKNCTNVKSSQLINSILLSENSKVSVKPVLKIRHDNVECTHGNTCGALNPEQIFYLTSRGIPEELAKKLLTESFAKELFLPLEESAAKKRLMQVLSE